jgi:uroporphyrinogen decarboxylase
MTPKKRILTALAHKEPDRVPFDLGATALSSIHYAAYNDLVCYLGKVHLVRDKKCTAFMDLVQSIVQVDIDFVKKFKVDARGLIPGSFGVKWDDHVQIEGDDYILIDGFGARWFRPSNGYYFDQRPGSFPLSHVDDRADIITIELPDPYLPDIYEDLKYNVESLGAEYAIVMGDPVGGIFATGFKLRGYDNFYMDLAGNPSMAEGLMEKLTDLKIQYWDRVLDEVGDLIDIALFEDDLGLQDRTMISPKMYRVLIKPHHERLFSFVKHKSSTPIQIMLHSDGSIYDLIPDLIDIGVDILNPIQVSAAKMDTRHLKKEFGSELVFWGAGVDTQGVLAFGSPADVEDEVKRRIDDLAPEGGFVFAAVHNIQPNVSPENIMAMWETLQEYGKY